MTGVNPTVRRSNTNPFPERDKRFTNWAYREYLILAYLWYLYPDARRWDVQRAVKSHPNESAAPTHRAFQRLHRKGQIKDAPRLRENARRENRRVRITSRGVAQLKSLETERGLDAGADIRAHVIQLQGSNP